MKHGAVFIIGVLSDDRPSVRFSIHAHPSGDATQHVTKWKIHPRSRVCPGGGRGRDSILRPSVRRTVRSGTGYYVAAAAAAHARNASHSRAERQTERRREGEPVAVAPSLSIIRPSDALVSHADPPLRLSGVSR